MNKNTIMRALAYVFPMLLAEEEHVIVNPGKKDIKPKAKRRQSATLFTVKDTKKFWKAFTPERLKGESFQNYKDRMKKQTGVLKWLNKRSLQETGRDKKGNRVLTPVLTGGSGSMYHR